MEQTPKPKTAEELLAEIMEIDREITSIDEKKDPGKKEIDELSQKKDILLAQFAKAKGEPIDKWRENL